MKNFLTFSLSALATLGFLQSWADANITFADDDLIVAFSSSPIPNHTGNTYLVDFGNLSQFRTGGIYADGQPHLINAGLGSAYLSDLAAAGISTAVGSTATFSIFGASDNNFTTSISQAETTRGMASMPVVNTIGVSNTDILTLINQSLTTAAKPSTAANSFIQATSTVNSYGKLVFGSSSPTQAFETFGNIEGKLDAVLDLYLVNDQGGNAPRIGAFDFDPSTGLLRFDSNVAFFGVPEPSTMGLVLVALGLGAMRRFRRPAASH